MNLTDLVVLVITMWGQTANGQWEYIGNQYVNQNPMTLVECSDVIAPKNWKSFETNGYYKIQLACVHIPKDK